MCRDRIGGAEDRGEQVLEIMRDAPGELAHRLEPLALGELGLQPYLRADVAHRQQRPPGGPVGLAQRGDGDADRQRLRAAADQFGRKGPQRLAADLAPQQRPELLPDRLAPAGHEQRQERRAGRERRGHPDHAPEHVARAHQVAVPVDHDPGRRSLLEEECQCRVERPGETVDQARRRGLRAAAVPGSPVPHSAWLLSRQT
jgi:hypothetical protein